MESKTFAACTVRDCVAKADTRDLRADVHSNLEKYVFFLFFYNESGLGSAKTISRLTRRNAGKVCFNKFQRSSTVLHALALMRWLWYEMVYEKASASWRACRIIVWGWKTCMHNPPFSFFAHQAPKHFLPKQKPTPPPIPETQLWPLSKNFSPQSNVDFREFVELRAGSLIRFFSFRSPKQ